MGEFPLNSESSVLAWNASAGDIALQGKNEVEGACAGQDGSGQGSGERRFGQY